MSAFKPTSYAEALQNRAQRPQKPRTPLRSPRAIQARLGAGRTRKPVLQQRADPQLASWGRKVKKRDGNKCRWGADGPCATGDGRIDPHHIAPRGRRPDLRYVVENGVSLCRTHHEWVHGNSIEAEAMGLLSSETYEKANKR